MTQTSYLFARSDGHVVRWIGEANTRPRRLEVLIEGGWRTCGWLLTRRLWRNQRERAPTQASVERLRTRACCPVSSEDPVETGGPPLVGKLRWTWPRWVISPPLGWGAPRWLAREEKVQETFKEGLSSFNLGQQVDEPLAAAATAGLESARTRVAGIEARAGTFVQAAALTSTLVLVNQGLITGDHPVRHSPAKWIFLFAIVTASAALIVSGIYGLFATMRTFDRIAPNALAPILERSRADKAKGLEQDVRGALIAQRRTSLIGDWKLARLKRATTFFGAAIALIALASGTFIVDATTHHADDAKKPTTKTTARTPKAPAFPDLATATIRPGDDASFLYTMPPFSKDVSGVAHFVTRDPLPVPGATAPRHVALATKPVEAREHHHARIRLKLSSWARRALRDHRTLKVGVRLEVRGNSGLSGYNDATCITLGSTPDGTHAGC
jgi:hypothetical protein